MSRLILAHAPGDEAAAQCVATSLGAEEALLLAVAAKARPLVVGAGAFLGIVWSRKAAESEAAAKLAEFAATTRGVFVVRADDAPLSPALVALDLVVTAANAGPSDLAAAMKMARLTSAHRKTQPVRVPPAASKPAAPRVVAPSKPGYARVFVDGLTRGLASSLAVVSVGGGVTFGIQETAGLASASSLVADAGTANADTPAAAPSMIPVSVRSVGIVSDAELAREADTVRQVAAAERPRVGELLQVAGDNLADARARTDRMLARLKLIADAPELDGSSALTSVATTAAAPVIHVANATPVGDDEEGPLGPPA